MTVTACCTLSRLVCVILLYAYSMTLIDKIIVTYLYCTHYKIEHGSISRIS
jgi:hypothetical protein